MQEPQLVADHLWDRHEARVPAVMKSVEAVYQCSFGCAHIIAELLTRGGQFAKSEQAPVVVLLNT